MSHASGCGIDAIIDGPIKMLTDAGILLQLSIDGDIKLHKKLENAKKK